MIPCVLDELPIVLQFEVFWGCNLKQVTLLKMKLQFSFHCKFDHVLKILNHLSIHFCLYVTFKQTRKIGHVIQNGSLLPYIVRNKNHACLSLPQEPIVGYPRNSWRVCLSYPCLHCSDFADRKTGDIHQSFSKNGT